MLDTSIVIHFFKKNERIIQQLDEFLEVFISTTVIGELYYGAYASQDPEKHIIMIEDFLLRCKIITLDKAASVNYGKIKTQLRLKGKLIPENDIWIAAVAITQNLPLFSTDNHYAEIPNIITL